MSRREVFATLGLGLLIATPVFAGQSPEPDKPTPVEPVRAVSREEVAVEEMERWIAEHPKSRTTAIRRLRALLPTVRDTALEDRVESRIRRLQTAMKKASRRKSPEQREKDAAEAFARAVRLIHLRPEPLFVDDNVRWLEEALQIAEGTSLEEAVWRQLERQTERRFGSIPKTRRNTAGGEDEGDSEPYAPGFGLRLGFGDYLQTTDHPLYPRTCLGLYYHFAESEVRRMEVSMDYLPSTTAASENYYYSLRLSYVRYVKGSGSFFWAAGGGVILEELYGQDGTFGYLDVAVGNRLNLGRKTLNFRFSTEVPVGQDLNAPWLLLFSVGYDF